MAGIRHPTGYAALGHLPRIWIVLEPFVHLQLCLHRHLWRHRRLVLHANCSWKKTKVACTSTLHESNLLREVSCRGSRPGKLSRLAVLSSLRRTVRHTGSVALASLILAICTMLNCIFEYLKSISEVRRSIRKCLVAIANLTFHNFYITVSIVRILIGMSCCSGSKQSDTASSIQDVELLLLVHDRHHQPGQRKRSHHHCHSRFGLLQRYDRSFPSRLGESGEINSLEHCLASRHDPQHHCHDIIDVILRLHHCRRHRRHW